MKLPIDAQLPRRLGQWLEEQGCDVRHTLELPAGNRTTDAQICAMATQEQRIVVSKDGDFVRSFFLNGVPPQLLLIAAGASGYNRFEHGHLAPTRNGDHETRAQRST